MNRMFKWCMHFLLKDHAGALDMLNTLKKLPMKLEVLQVSDVIEMVYTVQVWFALTVIH